MGLWRKRNSPYTNPSRRQAGFTCSVDMLNLPTLPTRMEAHLKERLIWHLKDACEAIERDASLHARDLPHEKGAVVGPHKDAPGGYDTGTMVGSFTHDLVEYLLSTGVFYDISSEEADYWTYVEFGHWVNSKDGAWFWGGYHLLEDSIHRNRKAIIRACREAWHDTAILLAAEARTPTPGMHAPTGTSKLFGR